jgi:hypothetical protein
VADPTNTEPGARLHSPDEAHTWVRELLADVRLARAQCDRVLDAKQLKRAYHVYLTKHGAALGSVMALYRCGMLSTEGYHQFRREILATLTSTIVEVEAP